MVRWIDLFLCTCLLLFYYITNVESAFVSSNSMSPYLQKGDLITFKRSMEQRKKYIPGDVIVFTTPKSPNQLFVHRVQQNTGRGYITKGDANQLSDEKFLYDCHLPYKHVVGKVNYVIPKIAWPLCILSEIIPGYSFLVKHKGKLIGMLIVYELVQKLREIKRKKKKLDLTDSSKAIFIV